MIRFVRPALFATAALLVASSCNVERPVAPNRTSAVRFDGGDASVVVDVVRFDFTGNIGTEVAAAATSVAPGITASPFTRGTGLTPSAAGSAFSSSAWTLALDPDVNDYVDFAVTPQAGNQITLTELSFAQQRSGTGPVSWIARLVKPDGSMADIAGGASATALATITVPIPALIQGPYSATVRIRIYAFGATGAGGTFRQDNVVLRGDFGGVAPTVDHVTVAPLSASVEVGSTQQFTATAFDASNAAISGTSFTWTGANSFASVSTSGLATGLAVGSATIRATAPNGVFGEASFSVTAPPPPPPPADIVISQIYGGGGNAGATLNADFIELYNRGDSPVSLNGWTVQYASAVGTSWQVQRLQLSIPAHHYYLIRLATGVNGAALPAPDTIGTINMAAGGGKVILSNSVTQLTGACPAGPTIIDRVGFGLGGDPNGCDTPWGGRTEVTSNTSAALRLMNGCLNTTKGAFDFLVDAPAPRNSTNTHTCVAASTASIVINEILAEPLHAAGGASWGEWFEVKNTGATPVDLQGWTITTQGQASHTISTSVVVPAGGIKLLGRGFDPAQNGGVTLDYNYFTSSPTAIFLDPRDFILLTDAAGGLADFARWTSSTAFVIGSSRGVKVASLDNMDVGGANWGYSSTQFGDGDFGTPGAENGTLNDTPSAFPNTISFTGRFPGDQALPVGFEDQLFATENLGTGGTLPTTFTWTSLTPSVASIDANGVFRALTAGSAQLRATAADGTTGTITLPTMIATLSSTANYGNHIEFGTPVDADPSDDFIVSRFTMTLSYNKNLNHPNWVSYNLDGSHIGSEDRCDCFTHDPELPASFTVIKTSDYTGAGAVAGFGVDRGHMARSFDRTTGTLDNATTYYFSNIIPQANLLNTQQWGTFETFLGDKARFSNKEVYIITGPAGTRGSVKNEGKINMPAWVWKVAVIMPRDKGLADVHNYTDVEVIAVSIANDPASTTPWQTWQVTVDSVEALTGYDLLSALPDNIEAIVEANIKPPLAAVNGPFSLSEGGSVSMSGAGSFDPNGSVVSYAWTFGDGSPVASGLNATHTYAQDGNYTVTLTVTDNDGLTGSVTTTATVANVAPLIASFAGASLLENQVYSAAISFTDPGSDAWTATVNYGDGTGVQPLALTGMTASLSHTYATHGTYTVTVSVSDDDATSSSTASVLVRARPVASVGGPYTGSEGSAVAFSGAGSTDGDGSIASYAWDFGDGNTGSGAAPSHTYVQDGSYTVTLAVTDNDGLTSIVSATTSVAVANVAPFVNTVAGATININNTYAASGTFNDPGSDVCTATVNYGDGSATQVVSLGGGTFALSHAYTTAGTYTVTLSVSDDDVTTTQTATVVVLTQQQSLANIAASIDQLNADGVINNGNATSLKAKINAATQQLNNGNVNAAKNQLNALLSEIGAMLRSGRLSATDANALMAAVQAVLATL